MPAKKKTSKAAPARRGRGRPRLYDKGEFVATTLWLRPDALEWLEARRREGADERARLARAARAASAPSPDEPMPSWTRSAIVRGILAALEDADVPLGDCTTEAEVRALVARLIRGAR